MTFEELQKYLNKPLNINEWYCYPNTAHYNLSGGWVQKTAKVSPDALISDDSIISDYAIVYDDSKILSSHISDNAVIQGSAHVQHCRIATNVTISWAAIITGCMFGDVNVERRYCGIWRNNLSSGVRGSVIENVIGGWCDDEEHFITNIIQKRVY
jgi:UDP-3-O-[3-hydroxymyristoyl] glucosamine N-acyltransferase